MAYSSTYPTFLNLNNRTFQHGGGGGIMCASRSPHACLTIKYKHIKDMSEHTEGQTSITKRTVDAVLNKQAFRCGRTVQCERPYYMKWRMLKDS